MSQRRERIMDAAYRAYGERHFRRLVWQERHLPWLLPLAGVFALVWLAATFAPPAVDAVQSMRALAVGWSWWWLGGAGLLLLGVVVRRARRPYRMPRRRWLRRGY